MFFRFLTFAIFQLTGALLGWWWSGAWAALAGSVIASWLWFSVDLLRGNRVLRWLRKKHRKAAWRTLRRYRISSETNERKLVWGEGHVRLRSFATGGTMPYPWRGIMITNGWDDAPEPRGRTHAAASWNALNRLIGLTTPAT